MNQTTIEQTTWAKTLLDGRRDHFRDGGLLLFSVQRGTGLTDYLRVFTVHTDATTGDQCSDNLTWALGRVLGYSLRDRGGQWTLALGGGGYSKPYEIVRGLAGYYGLETINYETL